MQMRKFSLIVYFCFAFISIQAQYGISFKYASSNYNAWNEASNNIGLTELENHIEVGVDYWIRLKNVRIEFLPELSYYRANNKIVDASTILTDDDRLLRALRIGLNTNFYPFDFLGDCDCPTFSKDGNFFTKGFLLQASFGASYWNQIQEFGGTRNSDNNIVADLGLGIGLDIGINDLITITPMLQYRYYPATSWENFNTGDNILPSLESKTTNLLFGIRLGLRPEFVKEMRGTRR